MPTTSASTRSHDEPLSKSRLRLWLNLLKSSKHIEDELRRRLRKKFQTTLPRFDVMSALYRYPRGLKMSEISQQLRVSNGNVTGIVDRLVEEAKVLRIAIPGDRRASLIKLTPAGVREFSRQAKAHEGWIDEMFSSFDAADIETSTELLEMLTQHTETNAP